MLAGYQQTPLKGDSEYLLISMLNSELLDDTARSCVFLNMMPSSNLPTVNLLQGFRTKLLGKDLV